jgi:hypothetical protein
MPGRGILRASKKEKIPVGQYSEYIRIWAMSNRNGQHGKLKVSLRARGLIAPVDGNEPAQPPNRFEKRRMRNFEPPPMHGPIPRHSGAHPVVEMIRNHAK